MKLRIISILVLILSFTSCEKEINLDYPQTPVNLVLNSSLLSGDTAKAFLGLSIPYENLGLPPYIDYGTLELFENGNLVGTAQVCKRELRVFETQDTIYTYCFDHIVNENSNYKIVARAPNFDRIQGETEIAKTAEIINPQITATDRFSFTIVDDPDEDNYYFFQIFIDDTVNGFINLDGFMTTQDLTIEMLGFIDDLLAVPTGENTGSIGFISDEFFNGGTKKVDMGTLFSIGQSRLRVLVTSCSKSYFEYSRTSILSNNNGDSPFGEPYQVHSNVSNGYGLVGSFKDTMLILR